MPQFDTLGAFSMAMTQAQIKKTEQMFAKIAGESIDLEVDKHSLNVFASELGVLRIFHRYRYTKGVGVEFSSQFKKWFFHMPYGK